MEQGDWHTFYFLSGDEAKDICKLGQGEKSCAYLVCGGDGFQCVKDGQYPGFTIIGERLKSGEMVAKGEGGWGNGCPC